MNDLSLFNFNGHDVRVVMIGDDPWWVASDVRRILGVAQSGSNFSFLSPEEVRPIPRGQTSGKGMAQARVLSESGLYKFVLRSDKAQARAICNKDIVDGRLMQWRRSQTG